MTFDQKTIDALALLRTYAKAHTISASGTVPNSMAKLVNTLDNAGVFHELDEQTDYASAEDILAESALASTPNTTDPAEWGDTTSAVMAGHQGYADTDLLRDIQTTRAEVRKSRGVPLNYRKYYTQDPQN
jgi:hypothetical protein